MYPRLRVATSVALLALIVAACGSSASSAAPSASASTAPVASAPATAAPDASSPAPSAESSAAPSASVQPTPTATPTAEQQALIDKMPKKVKDQELEAITTDTAAYIASDPQGSAPIVSFFKTLGIDPAKVILVGDLPKPGTTPAAAFVIAAYRFPGIDPATLKTEFVKFYVEQKQGSTSEEQTVGGRTVTVLKGPASESLPPIYLLFQGDTVYEVGSTDDAFATEALKALP